MKIEIERPNKDYPLAYVYVPLGMDLESEALHDILVRNRLTLLGRWEPYPDRGFKALALLEDEHVKPAKPRRRAKI